jgi:Tfp pilus assembly protein PilO
VTHIQKMRRVFTIALAIMAALTLGFTAYLLWGGSSTRARAEEQKELKQEIDSKKRQAAQPAGRR